MSRSPSSLARPPTAVPAVSVILPTHDRARLLARSAGSVLSQSFRDLELLVVDDASTEDLRAALAPLDDGRLRIVRLDQRAGGAGARNAGLAHARAPLVAFQDSDDEWLPRKLELQVAALAAHPEAAVCYTAFWRESGPKRVFYPKPEDTVREGDLHRVLLERNLVTTAATLVRRAALDEAGGFDATMPRYQDWDLWVRISRRHPFTYLDEPLLVQYHQPDSISANAAARLEARLRMLEKYRGDMQRFPGVRQRQLREVADLLQAAQRGREARRLRRAAKWQDLRDRFRREGRA
ncbi:MAG TPA: glycosyltransferase family A protein [Candidatus Thermoplasmatota archaeon]|nr:glycosyltransferase family A protein [Candidatus Thermoplasmatota archaeon]